MIFMIFLIILFGSILSECSNKFIDLNSNWFIYNSNHTYNVQNLTVPFSVHSALIRDKIIDDPYYRYNDVNYRWIVRDTEWIFVNMFSINDTNLLNSSQINIVFNSIDTIASVYLNDKFILYARNQFVRYEIENINEKLQVDNKLEIRFSSPIRTSSLLSQIYPYTIYPECTPDVQHGECHVNFLRKQQCSFSWDWGPAFAPIGLNDIVYLRAIEKFDFDFSASIFPNTYDDLNNWIIDVLINPKVNLNSNSFKKLLVTVSIDELKYSVNNTILAVSPDQIHLVFNISRDQYPIELWWPNGYGNQKLYDINISIQVDDQKVLKTKRSGFRSVQLVQDTVIPSISGLTFFFKINQVKMFFKGSNWIPAHSFSELITPDYLEWLMQSAKDSNMNVLRVWGGGNYESEAFYDLADKLGIMIWQDFMFACAVYPTDDDFIENVKEEVVYQVFRLRNRPSIVLWSGNNENEAAVSTNWFGTNSDPTTYANDYRKLYISTIMKTILKYDSEMSRPFLSSSPTNGKETISENWLAKNPGDLNYGDLHFYDYSKNLWDPASYPVPRFMSEFGIQSFSSISTLANVYNFTVDGDFYSDLNNHRQHHGGGGNEDIIGQIKNNLALPNLKDKFENFKSLIYLSQLNQAQSYKTAIELFRRSMNRINIVTGNGLTMGAMYWQFNDIWQAPTWSSIEFGGKWKMSHYFAKNAYTPVIISPEIHQDSLDVYSVSDLTSQIVVDLSVNVYSYESQIPKMNQTLKGVKISSLDSNKILSISFNDIQKAADCNLNSEKSCIITFTCSNESVASNFFLLNNKLTSLTNLAKANLVISNVEQLSDKEFQITIESDAIALFVWLDLNTSDILAIFSENGFQMVEKVKSVKLRTQYSNVKVEDIKKHLIVKSFKDFY